MTSDIHDTLGLAPGGRRKRIGRWIIAALVIVALGVVVLRMRAAPAQAVSPYRTETVQQGALTVSVTATGELKPVTQVNIGTEISGIVESVDVDFNSTVTAGQTLRGSTRKSSKPRPLRRAPHCNPPRRSNCNRKRRWPKPKRSWPCSTFAS